MEAGFRSVIATEAASPAACPVNTWNEWDPLEEVIVGVAWGAHVPPGNDPLSELDETMMGMGGQPFPFELVARVQAQIDAFAQVLEAEGVTVRRPAPYDLSAGTGTPFFSAPCGYNFMNARDLVLIVGDEIIEAPTASRTRYFETLAYRPLFKEYFRKGARWTSAPKPELSDRAYNTKDVREALDLRQEMTSEYEPVFDAADFVRCGRDIFAQRGARTNRFGIEWLRRHLGGGFRIHEVETTCRFSVHIDTTFVPIGPGRVLVNPRWIGKLPDAVKGWDVLEAPEPEGTSEPFRGVVRETSPYIAMNVFLLDEERIFVDAQQTTLIRMLKDRGMKPIAVPFELPPYLGGGFHCVTLDIRRRGTLQSYCSG
jgi:glycine amidinotransferase